MKKKIYMHTNVLPEQYGGRTSGIFRRASIAARNDFDIEVLFCGFQFQIEDTLDYVSSIGELDKKVKVTNMFNDLRKKKRVKKKYISPIDWKKYSFRRNKAGNYLLYDETDTIKRVVLNQNAPKIKEIHEIDKKTKIVKRRSFYDTNGTLMRVMTYFDTTTKKNIQRKRELFLNTDGSVFLQVNYKLDGDKSVLDEIIYKNGRYPAKTVKTWQELHSAWLDIKVKDGSVFFNSARKVDKVVMNSNLIEKGVDIYYWIHNAHTSVSYKPLLEYQTPSKLIVLTDEQRQELAEETVHKAEDMVVFNQGFRYGKVNENFDPKKLVIVSRFHDSQKNLLAAIDGFNEFYKTNPDFSLDIWGFGQDEQKIRNHIKELGIEDAAVIKGPALIEQASHIYANAAAFLITSKYEGLGKTIVESIACGCPVAAHDFKYGPKSFINVGVSGYIAAENTPEEYAKTIAKTVTLNNLYSREEIASNIIKFDKILEEEIEFLEKITKIEK